MPMVDSACREAGIAVSFFRGKEFVETMAGPKAPSFEVAFVLNLEAEEVPALTETIKGARAENRIQHVLVLDKRSSQIELEKAGLLDADETVSTYWRPNGPDNIRRMVRYCLNKYFGQQATVEPPIMIPDSGFYDPESPTSFDSFPAYVAYKTAHHRWTDGAPVAVLVIQQSFWITQDLKVVDAEVRALEKNHLNAVVVFGDREELVAALVRSTKPALLIEDRHGPMWQSNALLKELDVPYLRPVSMLASTVKEWMADPRGLTPRDIGLFMSLQESWGTLDPLVVGGLEANVQGFKLHEPIPDRIEAFAERAARWASLRGKQNAEKKIAIVYYNKGLGQDDLMRGSPTGGFLDGPESLMRFLPRLKQSGYTVSGMPKDAAELIARMKAGGRNIGPWAQGDLEKMFDTGSPILIPLSTYQKWFDEKLSEANKQIIIQKFGPPPGRIMVVTRNGEPQIVLPRIDLGGISLLPQPERGEKQDESLLHNRDVPPPHNYLAFYWWLDEQFKADAVVHWGTHGTLELLPGKEAGLSKDDWSDICTGRLPIIDLWITDNLGEATLARRRSYAELVDHLPPPALNAGLKAEYKSLHEDIHKFKTLEAGVLKEEFRKQISRQVKEAKLDWKPLASDGSELLTDTDIGRLDDHLHNLFESQTPLHLHVLGESVTKEEMVPYLTSILGDSFLQHIDAARQGERSLDYLRNDRKDEAAKFLAAAIQGGKPEGFAMTEALQKDVAFASGMRGRLEQSDREITELLSALAGHYLEAGPGPDPIRNPATAPGGRNLYALNPEEIPTRAAWEVGQKLVAETVRTRHPKKIAMDLNGMETMRDFGVMESQIFALLGVRPVWNRSNLVIDVELIPAEELKRPRVDVFIAMGGMYKENFRSRVALLDKAVKLAASAPEPDNAVHAGVEAVESRLLKRGFSSVRAAQFASARIFGTKPGNMSGTHILYLVPRSGVWDKDDEIASVYMDNMSFVYTGSVWGEKIDGLYEEALQGTDTVLRVWASNMTSQLSNHHAYEYLGGLSLAVKKVTGQSPTALIADVRDPSGARIRDFEEVLAANLQSELLNRNWVEGMKKHDYAGAGHVAELVKNTFGWAVTRPESVSQQTWAQIYEIYIRDQYQLGMREWFERVSPHALQEIAATMLESARKGIWHASPEQIAELSKIYADSVARHGDSGGLVSGGNTRMQDYVASALKGGGNPNDAKLAQAMQESLAKSAAAGGDQKVAGQKLESVQKPKAEQPRDEQAKRDQPKVASVSAPARDWWPWLAAGAALFLIVAGFVRKSGSV